MALIGAEVIKATGEVIKDLEGRSESSLKRIAERMKTVRDRTTRIIEQALAYLGVKRVGLPKKGRLSEKRRSYERQPWFRRLERWRCGIEATISVLIKASVINWSHQINVRGGTLLDISSETKSFSVQTSLN